MKKQEDTTKQRIGIAGAHRVGKSTFAKTLAEHLGIQFMPTSVSKAKIWRDAHITPSEQVTFAERIFLQYGILDHMADQVHGDGVFDRTFIDLIGYLYANVDQTASNLLAQQATTFVGKCLHLQVQKFDKIIIIQPGIRVVEDVGKIGKVFLGEPYIQAVNNHIIATAVNYLDPQKILIIPPNTTSLESRMDYVLKQKFI